MYLLFADEAYINVIVCAQICISYIHSVMHGALVLEKSLRSILGVWFRRLHGSTLEEVIDSVFAPRSSHEMLSVLKNALLRPCAVALIKVFLHI